MKPFILSAQKGVKVMSLIPPFLEFGVSRERATGSQTGLTKWEVESTVRDHEVGMALTIVLEYGTKVFGMPECEDDLRVNFRAAQRNALQKLGVLDADCNVVPGHEEHAERWGFGEAE